MQLRFTVLLVPNTLHKIYIAVDSHTEQQAERTQRRDWCRRRL